MDDVVTRSALEVGSADLEPPGKRQAPGRKRERYLPAFDLKPGMVLAKPLMVGERGVISFNLPAGETLTDALIRQLLARHAELACVEEDDERSDAQRQADIEQAEKRLEQIFQRADKDPTTQTLYDLLLTYRRS